MLEEDRNISVFITAAGGCGIDVIRKAYNSMNIEEVFGDVIDTIYVDSSVGSLIGNPDDVDRFVKIDGVGGVDGSGGEQQKNYENSFNTAIDLIASRGFNQTRAGDFHIVVFSAGGGTGSAFAANYIDLLLSYDCCVIAVMIGDTSTNKLAVQTRDTIRRLDNAAAENKRSFTALYVSNDSVPVTSLDNPTVTVSGADRADSVVSYMLAVILGFINHKTKGIDTSDMRNFFMPSEYKIDSPFTEPAIKRYPFYMLGLETGERVCYGSSDKGIPVMTRSLSNRLVHYSYGYSLYHTKEGVNIDKRIGELLDLDSGPITLVLSANAVNPLLKEINESCIYNINIESATEGGEFIDPLKKNKRRK
jgi:hypothetical protein